MITLEEIAASLPGTIVTKMFGMPCLKLEKRMYAGEVAEGMVFKLGPDMHETAMALSGTATFDPSKLGRPMKEWVVVPSAHMDQWMMLAEAAYSHVASRK